MERARRKPVGRGGCQHLHAEFQRIGFGRRRQFVDERFRGERRLRTIRIAEIAGAEGRPHTEGRLTTSPTMRRWGWVDFRRSGSRFGAPRTHTGQFYVDGFVRPGSFSFSPVRVRRHAGAETPTHPAGRQLLRLSPRSK
jgi:hypothetical protein